MPRWSAERKEKGGFYRTFDTKIDTVTRTSVVACLSESIICISARRARNASADVRRRRIFEALLAFQQSERRLAARALPSSIQPTAARRTALVPVLRFGLHNMTHRLAALLLLLPPETPPAAERRRPRHTRDGREDTNACEPCRAVVLVYEVRGRVCLGVSGGSGGLGDGTTCGGKGRGPFALGWRRGYDGYGACVSDCGIGLRWVCLGERGLVSGRCGRVTERACDNI